MLTGGKGARKKQQKHEEEKTAATRKLSKEHKKVEKGGKMERIKERRVL